MNALTEIKKESKKVAIMAVTVFAIAFLWALFFTYGFPFCWEDILFHYEKAYYEYSPETITFSDKICELGQQAIKYFFVPDRLRQISISGLGIESRPYLHLSFPFLKLFLSDNVAYFRLFRACIFACNVVLIFLLVRPASIMLACVSVFYYMTSGAVWIRLVYSVDPGVYLQCAMLLIMVIFLRVLQLKKACWSQYLLLYGLIYVISNSVVLTKGDGRYLALIFGMVILLFRRRDVKFHVIPLLVMLVSELPILGYISNVFTGEPANPILINNYNTRGFVDTLIRICGNWRVVVITLSASMLVLLCMCLFALIVKIFCNRKNKRDSTHNKYDNQWYNERCVLFGLWFLCSFAMMAYARCFSYEIPFDWQFMDCAFFAAPFILFFSYVVAYTNNVVTIRRRRNVVLVVCCVIALSAIITPFGHGRLKRVNALRGGWGNYFCAWHNAKKFIESQCNDGLVYTFSRTFYTPFYFTKSQNVVRHNYVDKEKACTYSYIERVMEAENTKNVFFVAVPELDFVADSQNIEMVNSKVLTGDSGDMYDTIKKMIGRSSKPYMHVYHFVLCEAKKTVRVNED